MAKWPLYNYNPLLIKVNGQTTIRIIQGDYSII